MSSTAVAWSPLGVAALGLVAAGLQQRRQRPFLRERIKSDLEIWEKLPEASDARAELLANVDSRVRQMIQDESEKRRDGSGMALGLVLVALFGWVGWWSWLGGGAWRLLSIPSLVLAGIGLVGFFTSLPRTLRDEKGNAKKAARSTQVSGEGVRPAPSRQLSE